MTRPPSKYPVLAIALAAFVLVAACAQTAPRNPPTATVVAPTAAPTAIPTPTATVLPETTATPAASPIPTATTPAAPTPSVSPTAVPTAVPTATPSAIPVSNTQTYTLSLEIEGISDESIVRGDAIVARGQTSPDAIVSINGVIVQVDENGRFEAPLMLDPGPNVIEVVASDLDGNQVSTVLAVVSLPEEVA